MVMHFKASYRENTAKFEVVCRVYGSFGNQLLLPTKKPLVQIPSHIRHAVELWGSATSSDNSLARLVLEQALPKRRLCSGAVAGAGAGAPSR